MTTAMMTQHHAAPGQRRDLMGFGTLLRLALRRDRLRLPLWIVGIGGYAMVSANALVNLYPEAADRQTYASALTNPSTAAIVGRLYGAEEFTVSVMIGNTLLVLIPALAAVMCIFIVIRHTRAQEDAGIAELLRASTVGHHAPTAAAMTVAAGAAGALGLVVGAGLVALGIEELTAVGAFALALVVTGMGWVFAAIALVSVQLAQTARSATTLALLILGAAFMLRAAADAGEEPGPTRWLSPLGWGQEVRPFAEDNLAPIMLMLLATAILTAVALLLSRRRDVGAGILPPRLGRATARPRLATPPGLLWRLTRRNVLGWAVVLAVLGSMYASLLADAQSLLDQLPAEMIQSGSGSAAEVFGGFMVTLMAILATVPAVAVVTRLRSEETGGRVDPLLASRGNRFQWIGTTVTMAVATAALVAVVFGLAFGASAAQVLGDGSLVAEVLAASLAYLPATLVIVGLATVLIGWLPRLTMLAWLTLAFAFVVLYAGGLLNMPQWLQNISPYQHVPQLLTEDITWAPLLALSGIAFGLMATGVWGYKTREVNVT